MKLVVSFYGMCLCVLDKRKGNTADSATVLLLNGAAPATRPESGAPPRPPLPYHHPLLFVPARNADLTRTSWSPVPAPDTLVDTESLVSGRAYAWSLSGLELAIGRGRGISMFENQQPGAGGRLADPENLSDKNAWLDWRRIPDLRLMAPGATLKTAYKKIGPQVLGMVRVSGGELRGGARRNVVGGAAPWRFSPTYSQVITDRFEFLCDAPDGTLKATGYAGGKRQTLALKGGAGATVHLTVIHEASIADMAMQRALPLALRRGVGAGAGGAELPHYTAFYAALQGKGVETLAVPQQGALPNPKARLPVIDSPDCPPALF